MRTLSLIVPVYDAPDLAARIASRIPALAAVAAGCGYELVEAIFADDGSSPQLELPPSAPSIARVLRLGENRGKGAAVRAAALVARGEWALMSDVDESAPLAEFAKLAAAADGAWMVCGSRWSRSDMPFVRRMLSSLFRLPVRIAGVSGIHDTQCGFKLFRMDRMRPIFEAQRIERFAFDVELILAVRSAGGEVAEVPVEWHGRRRSSLCVMRDAPRMLWDVIWLKCAAVRPLRGNKSANRRLKKN